MNMIGELVEHRKYGLGQIKKQARGTITVEFFSPPCGRQFSCPSCFQKELRFAEALAQKEIKYELLGGGHQPEQRDQGDF